MTARKRARLVKWVLVAGGALFGLALFIWAFVLPWMPIKTVLAYPILRRHWKTEAVAHFPDLSRNGARTVEFVFNPGFLQASTVMEWRVKFESNSFTNELARLSQIVVSPEIPRSVEKYDKTGFFTLSEVEHSFTSTILLAEPEFDGKDLSWNHGSSYGYAVSKPAREIIYWIEEW